MARPLAERTQDLWLPALVGGIGVLASLAVWGLLVTDRRDQLLEATTETAAETAAAIEWGLEHQVEALEGLSELCASFGLGPVPEWKLNAGQRVERIDGLTSVAWVDPDQPQQRITAGLEPSPGEFALDVEEARRHRERVGLVGPHRDDSGSVGYRVFLPVRTPQDHAGVLIGRLRLAPFFESVLRARASGYALSVRWAGEEILARSAPTEDRWQDWWRVERAVALPLGGGSWQLVLRPTPAFAALRLTPIPHYLLAAGIALSLLLATLAHQLRHSLRQSRFLAASNRALEARGSELEARVAERTAELEDAVEELEAFNYSVSHDLRSPLSAILNFTAILEEDYRARPLDAEAEVILTRIRRSASRASALLEDLLRLSRAGRSAPTLARVDMTSLARETFAQACAADGGAEVEFVVEPLPEAVGDRSLLGDVFANLFGNALKYSRDREKRRIAVCGRVERGECIYEISDNGQGFDMRFVDKIFGLFERLEAGEETEGTGVGLAVVERIVKRHRGRVWAEGRPGEGARFAFSIPKREAP